MDEKRKGEIAWATKKVDIRKELTFRDMANVKRNLGNLVKEPEMVAINVTMEELIEATKLLLQEVFNKQLNAI